MKILNLYCGIGGNRKLWGDEHEITAVELNPKIAEIYETLFPKDTVIITDAHEYLLKHYHEFDFIWSSPPCPTHSRMRNLLNNIPDRLKVYPDMSLYQEIIFLKHFFKGKFVIENVISYYDPLIKPQISHNHYFWSNVNIPIIPKTKRMIRRGSKEKLLMQQDMLGIDLTQFNLNNNEWNLYLNNCVHPKLGLLILNEVTK